MGLAVAVLPVVAHLSGQRGRRAARESSVKAHTPCRVAVSLRALTGCCTEAKALWSESPSALTQPVRV